MNAAYIERQSRAPIYEALEEYIQEANVPFHMPGHSLGRGADPYLQSLMGAKALAADITQVLDMDDIHRPYSYTKKAQELAAECFGADKTWFLVNGSTCGNQAMLLASLKTGQEVIMPRCAHRSLQAGLVFSGAVPRYVSSPYDKEAGVSLAVECSDMEYLQHKYPNVIAWAVTSVTPYGACADINTISTAAHNHGLPLLVDEAWGPHFGFHPDLPQSAISLGADCSVQSAHKLLAALSQASMLHIKGKRLNYERFNLTLRMLQSTSPNYLLLASLDIARRQLALHGYQDWQRALDSAERIRQFVRHTEGLQLMEQGAAFNYDKTRIVISALDLGIDGVELERTLRYRFKIQPEMSDMRQIVLVITPGHTSKDLDKLEAALKEIAEAPHGWVSAEGVKAPLRRAASLDFPGFPEQLMSPRQSYFSSSKYVPWEQALGEVCAELITPYPPGIPLICPGERIERPHWEYLKALNKAGVPIDGLSDLSMHQVRVIVG
ncbi:MAG: aminotransferase class I/II-fold pyridoxal phosphate-dependent enzyme [Candidatus Bruticola sp.]